MFPSQRAPPRSMAVRQVRSGQVSAEVRWAGAVLPPRAAQLGALLAPNRRRGSRRGAKKVVGAATDDSFIPLDTRNRLSARTTEKPQTTVPEYRTLGIRIANLPAQQHPWPSPSAACLPRNPSAKNDTSRRKTNRTRREPAARTSGNMKLKRAKAYRKLMHQYEVTFGFRSPYQACTTTPYASLGATLTRRAGSRRRPDPRGLLAGQDPAPRAPPGLSPGRHKAHGHTVLHACAV